MKLVVTLQTRTKVSTIRRSQEVQPSEPCEVWCLKMQWILCFPLKT